jgi:kinesin family protein 2/24
MGAKVTCFAYGQTGSGKTYTMNGDPQNKVAGLYVLGAHDIFSMRDQPKFRHLSLSMSFYEIYCGKLYDLLNGRNILQIREDSKQNVNVIGLTEKRTNTVQEFMQIISMGSMVRVTSQNSTNADSSRSHAILQLTLLDGEKIFGKISFIDLAGCERGADTI